MPPPARSAPPPPPAEETDGASANERLLAAAKADNEEMLLSALEGAENVNFTDGLGNTALHYAVLHASTDVLHHLLNHDDIDPDIRNRSAGETPLHIGVRQKWEGSEGVRLYIVSILLEAGADTNVKNRHNQRPIDLLPSSPESGSDDEKVYEAIRHAEAERMVGDTDVVADEDEVVDPGDVASDSD
ncbi:hypothetical protein Q5752_005831 [Cryptotrichosporon argae]